MAYENLLDSAYQVTEDSENFLIQYVALHFPQNIKRKILAEPARVPLVSEFQRNPEEARCDRSSCGRSRRFGENHKNGVPRGAEKRTTSTTSRRPCSS